MKPIFTREYLLSGTERLLADVLTVEMQRRLNRRKKR